MLFLLTGSPQKLKLEKLHGVLIFSFMQTRFLLRYNLVLKRMLRYYLKTDIIEKHKKTAALQQVIGVRIPNLVLNRTLELFPKIPPLKKILELED